MIPENGIGEILNSKVADKMYDDILSASGKETSKICVDLVKTARLLLVPLQITAAFQDKFENLLRRIKEKVPEQRYVEAPAEIVGPAIEKMKYIDEKSLLWQMFEELLTRSVDKEAVSQSHPAFVHIISQLSRDEAFILAKLSKKEFKIIDTLDLNIEVHRFENLKIEESDIPSSELYLPEKVNLYYSHLESLGLVAWPIYKQDSILGDKGVQIGVRRFSKMHLTEFGSLFVSVCVPRGGFIYI